MGIRYETLNLIQLGIGFFFIFVAFNSQGFIEQPVISSTHKRGGVSEHAGYYSLSIIYAVFTFSNFIAAPIVNMISAKWAMVLGASFYTIFQFGMLKLNEDFLYISSALLGLGAALLWTGQGSYLAKNCDEKTSGRNTAMLWAIQEACLVVGGIFLYIVFHTSKTRDNIKPSTVTLLYSVFSGCSCIGVIILALLRKPPPHENDAEEEKKEYLKLITSTFPLMIKKEYILLAFVSIFVGLETTMWTGIYSSCISFTLKLGDNTNAMLAINSICEGFGQISSGLIISFLRSKNLVERWQIILFATVVDLIAFAGIFINFPHEASLRQTHEVGYIQPQLWIALICGTMLCIGDGCFMTQINALVCDAFPKHHSQSFAISKFYMALMSCCSFYYGSKIQLQYHLLILVITIVIGSLSFFVLDRMVISRIKVADCNPAIPEAIEKTKTVDVYCVKDPQYVDVA